MATVLFFTRCWWGHHCVEAGWRLSPEKSAPDLPSSSAPFVTMPHSGATSGIPDISHRRCHLHKLLQGCVASAVTSLKAFTSTAAPPFFTPRRSTTGQSVWRCDVYVGNEQEGELGIVGNGFHRSEFSTGWFITCPSSHGEEEKQKNARLVRLMK